MWIRCEISMWILNLFYHSFRVHESFEKFYFTIILGHNSNKIFQNNTRKLRPIGFSCSPLCFPNIVEKLKFLLSGFYSYLIYLIRWLNKLKRKNFIFSLDKLIYFSNISLEECNVCYLTRFDFLSLLHGIFSLISFYDMNIKLFKNVSFMNYIRTQSFSN